jgi:hypothetical protein
MRTETQMQEELEDILDELYLSIWLRQQVEKGPQQLNEKEGFLLRILTDEAKSAEQRLREYNEEKNAQEELSLYGGLNEVISEKERIAQKEKFQGELSLYDEVRNPSEVEVVSAYNVSILRAILNDKTKPYAARRQLMDEELAARKIVSKLQGEIKANPAGFNKEAVMMLYYPEYSATERMRLFGEINGGKTSPIKEASEAEQGEMLSRHGGRLVDELTQEAEEWLDELVEDLSLPQGIRAVLNEESIPPRERIEFYRFYNNPDILEGVKSILSDESLSITERMEFYGVHENTYFNQMNIQKKKETDLIERITKNPAHYYDKAKQDLLKPGISHMERMQGYERKQEAHCSKCVQSLQHQISISATINSPFEQQLSSILKQEKTAAQRIEEFNAKKIEWVLKQFDICGQYEPRDPKQKVIDELRRNLTDTSIPATDRVANFQKKLSEHKLELGKEWLSDFFKGVLPALQYDSAKKTPDNFVPPKHKTTTGATWLFTPSKSAASTTVSTAEASSTATAAGAQSNISREAGGKNMTH